MTVLKIAVGHLITPKENNDCNRSSGDGLSGAETIDGMDVAVPSGDLEVVPEPQEIQDDVEEASREENEEAEAQIPRAARTPITPSQKQIEEHRRNHCPYRSWCALCLRGQAKDDSQCTVRGELAESSVVRVSMD